MKKYLCLICMGLMSLGVAMAQSVGGNTLTLTLDEAIDLALSDNPTVKVANLEVERYDYVRKQTLSSLYPQVDASLQYSLVFAHRQVKHLHASLLGHLYVRPQIHRLMLQHC